MRRATCLDPAIFPPLLSALKKNYPELSGDGGTSGPIYCCFLAWETALNADLLATLAIGIATLAALYARWSAKAAERANYLAVHAEMLRIFHEVVRFRAIVTSSGVSFPDAALFAFQDCVLLSEFYFSEREYLAIKRVSESAGKTKALYSYWQSQREDDPDLGRPVDLPSAASAATAMHTELDGLRRRCDEAVELLRPGLRLGK